ncbi:TA system antitoxin ParD family protein [Marinobacterium aestuariivivens]|uniref:ParD-like antitoxin of type II toxin-antitoxin system n=1 Tax=Marinobacterium aestuariivivens TaxID=1698799 RepID=A0ABW2A782_9GAMM
MAKASSPVRLDSGLMEAAALAGSTLHRSAAEQIEYWADLGRKVARVITPETLLEVQAGLAKLAVEKTQPVTIDPDALFATLDQQRRSGALQEAIASGSLRYQASREHTGLLEQVHPDGRVVVGEFKEGRFEPRQA